MTTLLERIMGKSPRKGLGLPLASPPAPAPLVPRVDGSATSFAGLARGPTAPRSTVPVASRANPSIPVWSRPEDIPEYTDVLSANGALKLTDEQRRVAVILKLKGTLVDTGAHVIGWTNHRDDTQIYESTRAVARQNGIHLAAPVECAADLIQFLNFGPSLKESAPAVQVTAADSEAVKLIDELFTLAANEGATDVHLLVDAEKASIFFRVGQELSFRRTLRRTLAFEIARVSHSISQGQDTVSFNDTHPGCENGKLFRSLNAGKGIYSQEIRWASAPTTSGNFDIVFRMLGSTLAADHFSQLGFDEDQESVLLSWMEKRSGLITVCGTTSSGKSTTLKTCSAVIRRFRPGDAIHSIESPVEYTMEGVRQRNVTERFGFAEITRQEMRMNPNVIIVGEVRDAETADALAYAVTTGHLVVCTLHASDQFAIVERLNRLGVDPVSVADKGFLAGLVHQSLVPLLCPVCALPAVNHIDDRRLRFLERVIGGDLSGLRVAGHVADCPRCKGSSKVGATVVASLVDPDFDMLEHLRNRELNLARLYRASGLQTTDVVPGSSVLSRTTQAHAIQKMRAGLISAIGYGALEMELTEAEAKQKYNRLIARR